VLIKVTQYIKKKIKKVDAAITTEMASLEKTKHDQDKPLNLAMKYLTRSAPKRWKQQLT